MHPTLLISTALAALATHATASRVNTGSINGNNIAWQGGDDPCKYRILGPSGSNPCGSVFTLPNGNSYKVSMPLMQQKKERKVGAWPLLLFVRLTLSCFFIYS